MQEESESDRDFAWTSDSNVVSVAEASELYGPSLTKVVSVRKTSNGKQIVSYREPLPRKEVEDPVSFYSKHTESVKNKYSYDAKAEKRRDYLEDGLVEMFGVLPITLGNIFNFVDTDLILYRLFTTATYTANNYFGKRSPKSVESVDVAEYIKELIPVSGNNQKIFREAAGEIEPPAIGVEFRICKVCKLKSCDSKSRLFCKVWIDSDPEWIETTGVVDEDASMEFNTRFVFHPEDLKTDSIVVELCEAEKSLNGGKELASSGSRIKLFFKQLSRTSVIDKERDRPNSIGRVKIRISNIYSEGIIGNTPLVQSNDESATVFLHFEAQFRLNEPTDRREGLKRHIMLLRICVEKCISSGAMHGSVSEWHHVLDAPACTLIFLHCVISSLTPLEDMITKFIVIANVILETDFSIRFLYDIFSKTQFYLTQSAHQEVESDLRRNYEDLVRKFSNKCFEFIGTLHPDNLLSGRSVLLEFESALRSIYLSGDIVDTGPAPLEVLKLQTLEWIGRKVKNLLNKPSSHVLITRSIPFLKSLATHLRNVDRAIQNVLPDESLTRLIFRVKDGELLSSLMVSLQKRTKSFSEIYLQKKEAQDDALDAIRRESMGLMSEIRELAGYVSKVAKVPAEKVKMANFLLWFEISVVKDWFQWTRLRAAVAIEDAVEKDILQCSVHIPLNAGQLACVSNSAETACLAMQKLVDLWSLVAIPRTATCDHLYLVSLSRCCDKYAKLMMQLVESLDLLRKFNTEGQRGVCIITNNLWYVHEAAERMVEQTVGRLPPDLENCYSIFENSCQEMFELLISNHIEDIKQMIRTILEEDGGKDEDTFASFVILVNEVIWKEVAVRLKLEVFLMFLEKLVDRFVEILRQFLDDEGFGKKDKQFHERLSKVLSTLREVCSAPEANERIWNEKYKSLLSNLRKKLGRKYKIDL